jgi:parallel beta-helix repeat protein
MTMTGERTARSPAWRPLSLLLLALIVIGGLSLGLGGPDPREHRRSTAAAAAVYCDGVVRLEQEVVDEAEPGDTICLEAGRRGELRLYDLVGTADAPITVINVGGQVRISAPDAYAAIEVRDSSHLRITGSGSATSCGATVPKDEQDCGIRLSGSFNGLTGKVMTEHLTIDHVEIGDVESAGVGIHDKDADADWVQHDVAISHSYLHDIGTEGFYLGASKYTSGERHLLDGVTITDNLVTRTGRDGIQVGSTPWNCTISGNVVQEAGLDRESSHAFGIIVNRGSSCDVTDNTVTDSAGDGIYDQGLHGQTIAGNTILRSGRFESGAAGINVRQGNQSPTNPETPDHPRSTHILNNTIEGTTGHGIRLRNDAGRDNRIQGNTITGVRDSPLNLGSGVRAAISANRTG